jgi:Skp family chaperone for outer membrane proteins
VHSTTRALAMFGLLLATTIGCGQFTGGDKQAAMHGKVAVIDLDSVARQLGYDNQMRTAIAQQRASLVKQLGVIQASFNEEITKKQSQFGANPSQEQTNQLRQQRATAVETLRQQDREAGKLLNQYQAQLVVQFRSAVKPAARAVAAEKGLSVILTKHDSLVFDYDTTVDITDAVVERIRAEQPAAPAPAPAPAASAPPAPSDPRDPSQPPQTTAPADNRAPTDGRF